MKRSGNPCCLVRDLREHPVDRLHAHFASAPSRVAMLASRLGGIPYSFTAHAKDIYQEGTDLDLLRDKIHAADFVVTVSEYNRRYLSGLAGGNGAGPIRRLYNGVDVEAFSPRARREGGPLVLSVGRLVEKKGSDDLLFAWPGVRIRHPGARLVIVGDGPERDRLEALAGELGVASDVVWAGPQPQGGLGPLAFLPIAQPCLEDVIPIVRLHSDHFLEEVLGNLRRRTK